MSRWPKPATTVPPIGTNALSDLQAEMDKKKPLEDTVTREAALFQYRDTIPKMNQIILDCLPNATTNPSQAALYDAFDKGDSAAVMQVPRVQRKQLFITRLSVD